MKILQLLNICASAVEVPVTMHIGFPEVEREILSGRLLRYLKGEVKRGYSSIWKVLNICYYLCNYYADKTKTNTINYDYFVFGK